MAPVSAHPAARPAAVAPPHAARRGAIFWLAHLAFWVAAVATNLLLAAVFEVDDPAAFIALESLLCFVATAVMRALSHREPLLAGLNVTKAGLIAGGAIISTVLIAGVLLIVRPWFGLAPVTRAEFVARTAISFGMLANWCAFYFGYQLIRERQSNALRAAQAEALALRNELRHLQAQISPHFLRNALNTVLACREDPRAIETVTQSLAGYLEFLLRPAAPLEPLKRELDALEDYLTIQSMRFGDGLETGIDCDFAARGVPVPAVMVQPLVENALKYGGATSPRPLRVRVTARREGDWLFVEVANTGTWVADPGPDSTGTGLHSLERRLRLLVDEAATVTHDEADGWVRVTVRVPVMQPDAVAVAAGGGR